MLLSKERRCDDCLFCEKRCLVKAIKKKSNSTTDPQRYLRESTGQSNGEKIKIRHVVESNTTTSSFYTSLRTVLCTSILTNNLNDSSGSFSSRVSRFRPRVRVALCTCPDVLCSVSLCLRKFSKVSRPRVLRVPRGVNCYLKRWRNGWRREELRAALMS